MTADDAARTAVFLPRPLSYVLQPLIAAAAMAVLLVADLTGETHAYSFRTVLFALLLAAHLVLGVIGFLRARRQPWAVKIGPAGVAWHDSGLLVPWSTIQEVQVPPRSSAVKWWLNGVRIVDKRRTEHAVEARNRPLVHTIQTRHLMASRDEILGALGAFAEATHRN